MRSLDVAISVISVCQRFGTQCVSNYIYRDINDTFLATCGPSFVSVRRFGNEDTGEVLLHAKLAPGRMPDIMVYEEGPWTQYIEQAYHQTL